MLAINNVTTGGTLEEGEKAQLWPVLLTLYPTLMKPSRNPERDVGRLGLEG